MLAASLATVLLVLATALTALSAGMTGPGAGEGAETRGALVPAAALIGWGVAAAALAGLGLSVTPEQGTALMLAGASPALPAVAALAGLTGGDLLRGAALRRMLAVLAPAALALIGLLAGGPDAVIWLLVAWGLPMTLGRSVLSVWPGAARVVPALASLATGIVVVALIWIGLGMDAAFWHGAGRGIAAILALSVLLIAGGALLTRGFGGDRVTLPLAAGLRDVTPAILVAAMTGQGAAAIWLAIMAILLYPLPIAFTLLARKG